MLLRKRLRGARLESIEQQRWDRVVRLRFAGHDTAAASPLILVAELLGTHGNLVLVEQDRVLAAWRSTARVVPGRRYQPPPEQSKRDPGAVTATELTSVLGSSKPERELVRQVDGLGPATARRLLSRYSDPASLAAALRRVAAEIRSPDPRTERGTEGSRAWISSALSDGDRADSVSEAQDRELLAARETETVDLARQAARRRLQRSQERIERTRQRVQRWLDAADSDGIRRAADLLMTHASAIPRGASQVTLEDPSTGETVDIALDPADTPIAHAQSLYRRARRIERGLPRATARLRQLTEDAEAIRTALNDLDAGRITPATAEQRASAPRASDGAGGSPRTIGGYRVEVGRSATENDAILRRANPHDLWLHVQGAAGAHVIVHRGDRRPVPDPVIRAAAALAMTHSKKRNEARAQVHVTEVRHVRKPKGAPPGLVRLTQADTLTVRNEPGGGAHAP
jgi:predicted ribosome quality control (RQC) complex YloA/Tae2 family protein